ncbi:MAG: tyrosine-type recombinase/integrase [Thermoleophilaceae bacterium]
MAARRPHGTGSLFVNHGAWYAQFRVDGRLVKRKVGPTRAPGSREGLTRAQAERELRRLRESVVAVVSTHDRLSVGEAGERLVAHLEVLGRKPATIRSYRSLLATHLVPHFGTTALHRVEPADVERLIALKRREGQAPKMTLNVLGFLHSVFEFGLRRGWCSRNPCKLVDKPGTEDGDPEIRFLDQGELEALLAAVDLERPLGPTDRALYLTAAMTGLRQAELIALRWRDIDWPVARVRVRRNYVRGEWGTPKTKRSSRAVPLADRVAGELDRHHQRSAYRFDDDLVFAHPELGSVLDHSDLSRRYKKWLRAAGVRPVRFHDLRHTFGTRMAAAGVPLRTLQEWMGHRDFKTTLVYADYQPGAHEAELVERAFAPSGHQLGINLSETDPNSEDRNRSSKRDPS